MACYHPLRAFRSSEQNPSGKRSLTFNEAQAYTSEKLSIPCGQCIGCRLERSRTWAVRMTHEKSLHRNNCFITLTYSNENLPNGANLKVEDFQKFMKRLRKKFYPEKIRFFHCGEYGENLYRPHYHAILFGIDFTDKYHWTTINEQKYYRSQTLETLWPQGQSMIGDVTWQSAAYVARYITKKVTGKNAEGHYRYFVNENNEYEMQKPEYTTMSRRPGIGYEWYKKYKTDCFPHDFLVLNGKQFKPPKYYLNKLEIDHNTQWLTVGMEREYNAHKQLDNNSPERLKTRETIQQKKLEKLKRNYDNGHT
ncbi:MAG: replication initiator protein [Microvirus sp.]|nr:MAG: replication initiator protein [Microvirus sp.]